jgi:hypothetical protein
MLVISVNVLFLKFYWLLIHAVSTETSILLPYMKCTHYFVAVDWQLNNL